MNDSNISSVNRRRVFSEKAYILFYKLQTRPKKEKKKDGIIDERKLSNLDFG